jgi:hypothetical protein
MKYKTLAYRQHLTVENPQRLILSNLPLKIGQSVEVLILVKEEETVEPMTGASSAINPAQTYTDTEWEQLEPEQRSELETQYILNNPLLMKQIQDNSEWFTISLEQLGIDLND